MRPVAEDFTTKWIVEALRFLKPTTTPANNIHAAADTILDENQSVPAFGGGQLFL
jgi:hypothetical protein